MDSPFTSHDEFAQAARTLVDWRPSTTSAGDSEHGGLAAALLGANSAGWSWTQPPGPYGKGYLARSQTVLPATRLPRLWSASDDVVEVTIDDPTLEEQDEDPASVAASAPPLELIRLTHHIVYSPTYRVPQLLLTAHSLATGAPTPLATLLAAALLRPPTSVALSDAAEALLLPAEELGGADFPLLSLAEHPSTGETVWALHPCHLTTAVDEIIAARDADSSVADTRTTRASNEQWLETWLMIVGSVVELRWNPDRCA